MDRAAPSRNLRRPSLWRVPLVILIVVLATTWLVAGQQASATNERRMLEFEAVTHELEHDLAASLGDRIDEFSVARDYLVSQREIDPVEFDDFLTRRRAGRSSRIVDDVGLTVGELVEDVDALESRERRRGRDDFSVFSLLPIDEDEHLVITNVEHDIEIAGRSLIGMDATGFRDLLEPPGLFDQTGILVDLAPINEILGGFTLAGRVAPDPDDYEEAVLYLIAPWENPDGSTRGIVIRLDSINAVVAEIEGALPRHFRLEAKLAGSDRFIAEIDHWDAGDESTQFETRMALDHAAAAVDGDLESLDIRVIASEEFRVAQETNTTLTWVLGILGAVIGAASASLRNHHARRLADNNIELELAQTMASTDPLTGLLNRQGLVESMEGPLDRRGTLIFVDIDNFKVVNDEHGHAHGDRVLRRIGHELRQLVRVNDSVCRLGGDEFLIFLPGTTIRSRIGDLAVSIRDAVESIDHRISASVGWVHRHTGDPRSIDELMTVADGAMYEEKRAKQSR